MENVEWFDESSVDILDELLDWLAEDVAVSRSD